MGSAEPARPDWNPTFAERRYYRHKQTGDRGYLVVREGRDMIRYDMESQERLSPLKPEIWKIDEDHRPLTIATLAQVAHAADCKLVYFLGRRDPIKEWGALTEANRQSFMREGPTGDHLALRKSLFNAIMANLSDLAK